ncbi:MAG: AI-2E family transporter [Bacteroidaceae bacterium]|nr:AI-2E family transporter [Bacteroidaceae bacterium]
MTITFDRFIRVSLWVGGFVIGGLLLRSLSGVLIPFFVAWILAYMMYPMVCFFQYRCHLRSRTLSIFVCLLIILAVLAGLLLLIIPPTIAEMMKLKDVTLMYVGELTNNGELSRAVQSFVNQYVADNRWVTLMENNNVVEGVREALTQLVNLISSTVSFLMGLLTVFATLLYLFFILLDYESISEGWIKLIPAQNRNFCRGIAKDVKSGMSAYFRGQSLIAFCVGVLFSIGFLIIDFPMAVCLGMFIGLLNMVPYLQLIGFVPTIALAMIESADEGRSLWGLLLAAFAVFCIVQVIQDMFLTPRIMGKTMGLNPAIIFLALSIWGSLLGFIGLVIALPLTTILISYYRRMLERYE